MDDDFNTPKAFAALFEFASAANTYLESPAPSPDLCRQALDTYRRIASVLTLFQEDATKKQAGDFALRARLQALADQFHVAAPRSVDGMLDALLKARTEARAKKQWAVADSIRAELLALGFEIQDTDAGPVWRKK
jgi:cysteinyl-tRNA synthetase